MSTTTLSLDQRKFGMIERQNKRLKSEKAAYIKIANIIMIICGIIFAAAIFIGYTAITTINDLRSEIVGLNSNISKLEVENQLLINENEQIKLEAEKIAKSYNKLSNTLKEVSELSVDLDSQIKELISACESKDEIISTYEEREELFDKYEYAVLDKSGSRTDINYSDMKMLEDLAKEKGMTKETVNLVLAITMTESNGTEKAKNNSSTATGFGQFLNGTGRFVYKELMGNSTYNHTEIAGNGTKNLQMMMYYLDYLNESCNGNVGEVINRYRGLRDSSYKYKINSYLASVGLSLGGIRLS